MGEDQEDDDGPFLPGRLFHARAAEDRRSKQERARERQIAERVSRRREQGGRPTARTRRLGRSDIVAVAVAIADAEGTEAVSMRRIAKELQVGAMSLYWHIDSKEELHHLMLETVQAEIEAADPTGDWRADLTAYARSTRAAMHRHPWAIDYLGAGPPSGPNDARNADQLMAALDGLGLDIKTAMWIPMTLGTYVLGAALREIQETRWQCASDETMAGMTEAEIAEAFDDFERRIRESGRYPHIAQVMEAGFDPDAPETRDERFEFGLSCVLDGIAARIKG
ncbi:MAG TPA: TetR/AcrR family transcriptional regulator [Trebonia sp.]|jgi:AcrR family transcriptional regulator|nr:TetR/AcrR family transcriptional regulator [Trebonia sp.]